MPDPRVEIGELWRQVNRAVHERFRHAFREYALPPVAMILLRLLFEEPGMTVSELARRSGTVKSHVSKLVDQLAQQGYLEKRADPADQRLVRIYTTKAAGELKARLEGRARAIWLEVMAEVPDEELPVLERAFRMLLTAFDRSANKASQD